MTVTQQHEVAAILAARAAAQLTRARRPAPRLGGVHRRPAPDWRAPLVGIAAMMSSGILVGLALTAAVVR